MRRTKPLMLQLEALWQAIGNGGSGGGTEGPPGPKGDKGDPGEPGSPGNDGAPGADGQAGPQGIPGERGETGPQGPPGNDGNDGSNGSPGADGPSAYQVATSNGFQGNEAQWLASLVGAKGDKGDKGNTGDTGSPGLPGTNGSDGNDGTDGASAYQIAVASGFVGTEAQWLLSLKGAPGDAGDDGAPGLNGKTVLSGSGAPTAGVGSDGDFYIRLDTSAIYGPKVAGAWGAPTSLIGPQGIQGNPGSSADPWTYKKLALDFTAANSTAFSNITDGTTTLSFTPPANTDWELEGRILIWTTAAANLPRVGVNIGANAANGYGSVNLWQAGATATTAVQANGGWNNNGAAVNIQMAAGGVLAANTPYQCEIIASGRSGNTPQAITIQLACETAAANTCLAKRGSFIKHRTI